MPEYLAGATLPACELTLLDTDGSATDLTNYTVTIRVGPTGQAALIEKTTGITVLANVVTVDFTDDELDVLANDRYELDVIATAPGGRRRKWKDYLRIDPALDAPA